MLVILAPCFLSKTLHFVFPNQEPRIPTGPQVCWGDEDILE